MPKACPYNLKDYIYTYAEQMHRVFGLTRKNSNGVQKLSAHRNDFMWFPELESLRE